MNRVGACQHRLASHGALVRALGVALVEETSFVLMFRRHSELEIVIVIFGECDLFEIVHILKLVSVAYATAESMHYAHL